eukprot:4362396-Pyramimonas_sp.AAC.1
MEPPLAYETLAVRFPAQRHPTIQTNATRCRRDDTRSGYTWSGYRYPTGGVGGRGNTTRIEDGGWNDLA